MNKKYFKDIDKLNVGEIRTVVDKGNHQYEFEGARKDAEKFAMKYCRKSNSAIRSSRKNGMRVYDITTVSKQVCHDRKLKGS